MHEVEHRQASSVHRRPTPRVAANIPIEIGLAGCSEVVPAHTRDIGVGGLCAITGSEVTVADIRFVDIPFPGRRTRLRVDGRWQKRLDPNGAVLTGLAFQLLDSRDAFFLWSFVQSRAQEIVHFLYHQSEIAGLGLSDLLDIALFSRLRKVPPQAEINRQLDPTERSDSIFFVFRGCVSIRLDSGNGRSEAIELREGSVFGGLHSLLQRTDAEEARASSEVMLLELDRFAIAWLRASRPVLVQDFGAEISRLHEARMRTLGEGSTAALRTQTSAGDCVNPLEEEPTR